VDRCGVILKGNGHLRRSEQRELECGASNAGPGISASPSM
jgi:hypothetical protein